MTEWAWVVAIVAFSLLCSRLQVAPWLQQPLGAALVACAVGVAGSLVTGVGYHAALWRTLGRRGRLPPRWWWSPTTYHPLLLAPERARVLPWFYAGATAFVVVLLSACWALGLALL